MPNAYNCFHFTVKLTVTIIWFNLFLRLIIDQPSWVI